jgi:hypothetical protein
MQFADIVVTVRLAPPARTDSGARRTLSAAERADPARTYDALIYTDLPSLTQQGLQAPSDAPAKMGNLPLASVESLRLNWEHYQRYLAQFLADRKSPGDMSSRLFETMSPGLERLFSPAVDAGRPLRIWWHPESVELEDFPWELVAYMDKAPPEIDRFSFVRGLPPATPPSLAPLKQGAPLRLAIMAEPETPSSALEQALSAISGLQVVRLSGSPRDMLKQVTVGKFELLHIICDGIVSLAYDGTLYFHGAKTPELDADELASSLLPTSTVCLGLSSTYVMNPDLVQISGRDVPSAYRAFAYLARANQSLPTMVTPLAPADLTAAMQFWRAFYSKLVATLSIEQAMAEARKQAPLPVALHLRHPGEQQFRRRSALEAADAAFSAAPGELGAELELSQRLVQRLEKITTRSSNIRTDLKEFLQQEKSHQSRLSSQLAPWRELDKQ